MCGKYINLAALTYVPLSRGICSSTAETKNMKLHFSDFAYNKDHEYDLGAIVHIHRIF